MVPDIRMKEYYLRFIHNAIGDIKRYKEDLAYYNDIKNKQVIFINNNKDEYKSKFKIFIEDELIAIKRAEFLIKTEEDINNRFLLSRLCQYGNTIKRIAEYEKMIIYADKRKNIKYRDYETYVSKYYNRVHKFVLQGYGYQYNYGIGILAICRWKINSKKRVLDYSATAKRKKELLAAGKKLYDKLEAEWYARRNIPYDGIDYRVFNKATHIYDIDIFKSKLFNYRYHKFKHTEYVNVRFKGMAYKEIADICNNLDDISNLPVDLRYKLNITLYKDPACYLLYIRNDEEDRHKHGAHNS